MVKITRIYRYSICFLVFLCLGCGLIGRNHRLSNIAPGTIVSLPHVRVLLPTNLPATTWDVTTAEWVGPRSSSDSAQKNILPTNHAVIVGYDPNNQLRSFVYEFSENEFTDKKLSWLDFKKRLLVEAKQATKSDGTKASLTLKEVALGSAKCMTYQFHDPTCRSKNFPNVSFTLYLTGYRCQSPYNPNMFLKIEFSERLPAGEKPLSASQRDKYIRLASIFR